MAKIKSFLLFLFGFILFSNGFVYGLEDYQTRIAIVPMENNTGDTQYDALCQTVTETIGLVLQFLKDYSVLTQNEIPEIAQVKNLGADMLKSFGEKHRFDEIIYGTVVLHDEGGFFFTLSLFSTVQGEVKLEETAVAETIFDVFDVADTITLEFISHISDIHIGFGAIELIRGEGYGTFEVYLDDKPVKNYEQVFQQVLNDNYTISIHQERLLGDTAIFQKKIDVFENQVTSVVFDIKGASEEEFRYLEDEAEILYTKAKDTENLQTFLSGIAEFQRKTQRTSHDLALDKKKEEILEKVGNTAVQLFEQLKRKGDELYYARKPDFKKALKIFQPVSGLLNDVFAYTVIDDRELDLRRPTHIETVGEKGFFVLDRNENSLNLRSFSAHGDQIRKRDLNFSAENFKGDIHADPYGKLYVFNPLEKEVIVFDGELNVFDTITIPDYQPVKGDDFKLVQSNSGMLYIIASNHAVVFHPSGEVEEEGTTKRRIVRRKNIENAVLQKISEYNSFPVNSVFFDKADRLHVFSSEKKVLLRFDSLGNFHSFLRFEEAEPGSTLKIDSLGYYYLTFPEEGKIGKYSPEGAFVTRIGEFGDKPGQFSKPMACDLSDDGTVYVADTFNQRIQILHPTSPPVLLPAVSQYGVQFKRREKLTRNAIEKLEASTERTKQLPITVKTLGAAGLLGGSVGLQYTADLLKQNHERLYQYLGVSADITQYAFIGTSSMLLFSAFLNLWDRTAMYRRVVDNVQRLSLDRDYLLDENKYKSLRKAKRIGFLSGVVPVLAGAGALGVVLAVNSGNIDPLLVSAIVTGSVALPPIFSHIYSGKFHPGLFMAGLAADAMAVTALLLIADAEPDGHPAFQQNLPTGELTFASTLSSMRDKLPIYLMVAALFTRLSAGIWDMRHGWIRTHEYNQYKADSPPLQGAETTSREPFQVLPILTMSGRLGIACTLSF